jgi:hypothetical protein
MRYLASLKAFLATGRLGPISTELNLRQVADLLGTPQDWIFNDDAPFYWIYSETGPGQASLEIAFSADAPHPVYWFQIEDAHSVGEVFNLFGEALAMTGDGLSGASTPAEFLRSGAFDPAKTKISLNEDFLLAIVTDHIIAYFNAGDDGEEEMSDEQKRLIFDGFGKGLDFRADDRLYRLNSIYSFHEGGTEREWTNLMLTDTTCSIAQYLAMIDGQPGTAGPAA